MFSKLSIRLLFSLLYFFSVETLCAQQHITIATDAAEVAVERSADMNHLYSLFEKADSLYQIEEERGVPEHQASNAVFWEAVDRYNVLKKKYKDVVPPFFTPSFYKASMPIAERLGHRNVLIALKKESKKVKAYHPAERYFGE